MKVFDIKNILPEGEYEVVYNDEVLARFKTLEQAQAYKPPADKRTTIIRFPDLRSKMTKDQIAEAEALLKRLDNPGPI